MTPERPEALQVLFEFVAVLEELGLAYHVGGSCASSIHGLPRQTQDIDMVVDMDLAVVPALIAKLERDFYLDPELLRDAVTSRASFNAVHYDSALKIDVFVRGIGAFDVEEFVRSQPVVVQGSPERHVVVKTAEDTVLRKLQGYRMGGEASERQWADVIGILRVQHGTLDSMYLERWSTDLGVDDLLRKAMQSI